MLILEENIRTPLLTQGCAIILILSLWTSTVTSLSIYGPGYERKDSEAPVELQIDFSIVPNSETDSIHVPTTEAIPVQRRPHNRQHNRQHHTRQTLKRLSRLQARPLNLERGQVSAVNKRTSLGEIIAEIERRYGRGSQQNSINPVPVRFGIGKR